MKLCLGSRHRRLPDHTLWVRRAVVFVAGGGLIVACQGESPAGPPATRALETSAGLAPPSNTYAVADAENSITVSWRDNSGSETAFEVERSTSGSGGTFVRLATTSANVTGYRDSGLEPGTEYCYRIRAARLSGKKPAYSSYSNVACATPPLAPPSNVDAVAVSQSQVDVRWQDNSSLETGFEVHRSTTGINGAFTLLATTGANVEIYRDQGLEAGKEYCYQVRAARVTGSQDVVSRFLNTDCATTMIPLAAASGLYAWPMNSATVEVWWSDNSTNEDGFRIDRSIDGGATWESAGTTSDSWFHDLGRQSEQGVCYRVVAFNAGGDAPPSSAACTTPPAAPTNLTVIAVSPGILQLTWNDNSDVEDGYQIWGILWHGSYACSPCEGGGCNADTYAEEGLIIDLPPNSTTYTLTEECNMDPPYYVVATRDGGRSDPAYAE